MVIEKAIEKMLNEMQNNHIILPIYRNRIRIYLYMAHGIGYNHGLLKHTPAKRIAQMDVYGNILYVHESAESASRSIKGDGSNIRKVCAGKKHSAYGFLWKYV